MVRDLTTNHLTSETTKQEVIQLLGKSNDYSGAVNEFEYGYLLAEDYGWDIDPIKVEFLVLEYNADSALSKVFFRTWKQHSGITNEEIAIN